MEMLKVDNRVNDDPKVRIIFILSTFVQMAIAFVIFIVWHFAIRFAAGNLQLHIIFSVTGYQFLMLEAVMSFSGSNSWSFLMSRKHRRWAHLGLQALAGIFIIVGFSLAVVAKSNLIIFKHFQSAHAICGLIGFIFTLICLLNGTVAFMAPSLRDKIRPTTVKFLHTLCGCIAIIMGLTTLCFGMNKDIFILLEGKSVSAFATAMAVLSIAFGLLNPAASIQGYLANMRSTEL